ncbi:unnamed protein product [Bathycoccus prasinos]
MSSEYLTEEEHERLQRARSIVVALENKPLPLWRLFREALLSGGACRDIVEKHVMCKLNGTDLKFFYEVNTETRKLVKRSSRESDLKKKFNVDEMSSISTLEVAWENKSLWSGYLYDESDFCWEVARKNKLELLKWAREEKECEWDELTITAAARRGNLEMVKYCVANECPIDETACAYAAENGHLEVLKYLREEAKVPWDSDIASYAASNGHLHILEYLVEREYDNYDVWSCISAAENGHLDCLKYLHETAKAPWDYVAVRVAREKNQPECLQYLLDNNCPLPRGWRYEHGELFIHGPDWLSRGCAVGNKKHSVRFIESSDGFGGRARTDIVDGYILDRGFAIYLSSYEECNKIFDTKALDLRKFYAGADVRFENQFYRVADPFRHIGSPLDKVLVGLVRFQTLLLRMNPMQRESSETIEERLNAFGFSEEMVDRFFRPFLGGIFFNPELTTDSRLFDFVMRSLALGENCLPAKGIGAMAEQLVGRLDEKNVHANAKVQEIRNLNDAVEVRVQMMNKEEETIIRGKKVILAVEGPECDRLLGTKDKQREKGVGTTCVYFSCDKPELSDEQIGDRVKSELSDWFGESITSSFKLLKVYRIPFAQPIQTPSAKGSSKTAFEQTCESGAMKNVYLAGDHRDAATFDGALISGRRCAEYAKSKM